MIAIVDYGVGNLFSLKSSFAKIGADAFVTGKPDEIKQADKVILPGVGAFADAMEKLRRTELDKLLVSLADGGKPLLGICLGMQLLFEKSYEYGEHCGLGLIKGEIVPIKSAVSEEYKIPQIGWNSLEFTDKKSKLFKYIKSGDFVYFVHSYYAANCENSITAVCDYGAPLTASVEKDNVYGCQFHPEKSGDVGLNILRAFCEL